MKWSRLPLGGGPPDEAPGPRSSHSLNAIATKLYLFGGEYESRKPVDSRVHVYDLSTQSWSLLPSQHGAVPSPRVAHTCCVLGTDLLIFGGRSGQAMSEGARQDLYRFDTLTNEWEEVDVQGPAPPQRSYHTACVSGGKMWVFGGCGEAGRLNDLWAYDPEARAWSQMPTPDAKGRGGSSLIPSPDGSRLWVVGGFSGEEMGDMHEFNTQTRMWTEVAASGLPPRSVFGAAVHTCPGGASACGHAGHLVAFGGEVDPSTQGHAGAGSFSDDLLCWDAAQGWHKLEASGERPCARGWFAAALLPTGNLVVHGGLDCANNRLGDMFLLDAHGGPECARH